MELGACPEENMNKAEEMGWRPIGNTREEELVFNSVTRWYLKTTFEKERGLLEEGSGVRTTTRAQNYYSGFLLWV